MARRQVGADGFRRETLGELIAKGLNFQAVSFQVIPRRLNTGTLTMSTVTAKTAAPKSVPPITNNDRGAIAMPRFASVEAINRSATDESTSQELGRIDQRD